MTTTYVHAHNMANELTSVTANGGTTNFSYDYWGRMVSKSLGSYTTSYAWHYGGKLTRVAGTFPGEGTVSYAYGGDQKRRERNDGTITKYNWDMGWNMINEENSAGSLTMTYVEEHADLAGSTPSGGTSRYYALDDLGSVRSLWSSGKLTLGTYEFSPFGDSYAVSGADLSRRFRGHYWDAGTGLYFEAGGKYYSTIQGRSVGDGGDIEKEWERTCGQAKPQRRSDKGACLYGALCYEGGAHHWYLMCVCHCMPDSPKHACMHACEGVYDA